MFLFSEDYMKVLNSLSYLDLLSIDMIVYMDYKKINSIFSSKCRFRLLKLYTFGSNLVLKMDKCIKKKYRNFLIK